MLVVDMINVHVYRFWAFPDLISHFENTGIGVFWLHYPQDSKETELGNSDQEVSPSVLETFVHGTMSLQLFPVVWIFSGSLRFLCYGR